MRIAIAIGLATAVVLATGIVAIARDAPQKSTPTGRHFTLNVLGKETIGLGTANTGGSKLFVPLYGKCRVDLSQGAFAVKDADCLDDGRAAFQLPDPDPENDGTSAYSVYVRPLAKPGGWGKFTTCLVDTDGVTWCSTESVVTMRGKGKSSFTDVSRQLLTVCYDADADGDLDREQVFDDANKDYFWSYDNVGLRLAQLRFYPAPADISGAC